MRRILIVDDNSGIVQLLSDHFKGTYAVDVAMSGGAALGIVRRQRPDLVLLDIILPDMSGLHLLRAVRQIDPTIAVVMLTGSDNTTVAAEALRDGAAGFLLKPFDLGHLNRLVAEILAPPTSG